jgi:hypothetical protein
MDPIVLVLAVLVGVTLGLLGGGGSILLVPLLVYVGGLGAKEAIATSLLVVLVTSAVAAVPHARAGRVRWRTAGPFGAAGMAGAYLGGRVGSLLDGTWLLVGFAVMMLVTAVMMLRGRRTDLPADHTAPTWRVLLDGIVVGLVTGIVGAGGGFLVVPALVLLGGLPMPVAVGTSLAVIAMKSAAGLAGYLSAVDLDWSSALTVAVAAASGAVLGARLVDRVPSARLRRVFGWFVVVMSFVVLAQEAPPPLLRNPLTWLGAAATLALVRVLARSRSDGPDPAPPPDTEGATTADSSAAR